MRLTREMIFAAQDLTVEAINVPEWGGEMGVRILTGLEMDKIRALAKAQAEGSAEDGSFAAALVVYSAVNEDGSRMFTDADAQLLRGRSSVVLDRVFAAAAKLNGLTKEKKAELGNDSAGTESTELSGKSPSTSAEPGVN